VRNVGISILDHYDAGLSLGLSAAEAAEFAVMCDDLLAVLEGRHKDYSSAEP
jgi:hypothetical protein